MRKDIIVYVDMDNVLVDFQSALNVTDAETLKAFKGNEDEIPGVFGKMKPLPHAVESFKWLAANFDTYILSTAPWENNSAWNEKHTWVKHYLGDAAHKRLILSHHKNLLAGDYIIDDRDARGVDRFVGKHLFFGPGKAYPTWASVIDYFKEVLEN